MAAVQEYYPYSCGPTANFVSNEKRKEQEKESFGPCVMIVPEDISNKDYLALSLQMSARNPYKPGSGISVKERLTEIRKKKQKI
jgi:hypothetical protein